jgi:protease PrsW
VSALGDLLVLVLVALIPALIYLTWVRQTERYSRQAWGGLLGSFVYGAIVATIVAAILELIIVEVGTSIAVRYPAPEFLFLNGNSTFGVFFLVLVVAPFIEEGLKASGVVRAGSSFRVVADGLVFGAAVGLGFGFFETFLYGVSAYAVGGLTAGVTLIVIRSLSSVLLHGSSTSMFGYGYAQSKLTGRSGSTGAYYLLAVLMHATFNALASLGAILTVLGVSSVFADYGDLIGLLLAFVFAWTAIEYARGIILQSDFPGAMGLSSRYRPPPVKPRGPP